MCCGCLRWVPRSGSWEEGLQASDRSSDRLPRLVQDRGCANVPTFKECKVKISFLAGHQHAPAASWHLASMRPPPSARRHARLLPQSSCCVSAGLCLACTQSPSQDTSRPNQGIHPCPLHMCWPACHCKFPRAHCKTQAAGRGEVLGWARSRRMPPTEQIQPRLHTDNLAHQAQFKCSTLLCRLPQCPLWSDSAYTRLTQSDEPR